MPADFPLFSKAVNLRLQQLTAQNNEFYKVNCPEIFDHYLAAFPSGTNPIFRERTEHDCQCCKQFIRNLGLLVAIEDGALQTVWGELGDLPAPYDTVAAAMDELVKSSPIASVFRTKESKFGIEKNFDSKSDIVWHHFYGDTPRRCVVSSPGEQIGSIGSVFSVFERGLKELRQSDFDEVIDLIDSNAIYRGEEHRKSVVEFRSLQRAYNQVVEKDLFVWANINSPAARFRNTVIGTLLIDLSEDKDLEVAVKAFESKVAPSNYKRPTALITPRMIEQAVLKLKELDLEDSINRRLACIEDISVNDIIFVDNDVAGRTKDGITELLMQEVRPAQNVSTGKWGGKEIGVEEFISMRSRRIEMILESQHLGNFVSITAPVIPDSRPLFKWDNGFAWSYDGDVADSIKQRVKKAGGNIEARLRCSLAWFNHDDLDIHCREPNGNHIYYSNKSCVLDVDMNAGGGTTREPVENLSWNRLMDGQYKISVHNFRQREAKDTGFQLEVEFEGQVHHFSYDRPLPNRSEVHVLTMHVENGKLIKIDTHGGIAGGSEMSTEKWGVKTLLPTRVNMMMLSPNHWENSSRIGNKHYFFILDKCLNPDPVRGIYNEFLANSLDQHRKVFEVLGAKTKCQPSNNQLSGVGFSSTQPAAVKVIADGRPFTIKF